MKKLIMLLSVIYAFAMGMDVMGAPVNVNTADAKTISAALTGIGPKKAEAIVKYREEKGLFKTVEDLAHVSGIGEKTVEKNKSDILLGDAAPVIEQKDKK